jgi:hypothetical protein
LTFSKTSFQRLESHLKRFQDFDAFLRLKAYRSA